MAYNFPRPLLAHVRRIAGVSHAESLVMLDLYGFLEHRARGHACRISQRSLAKSIGVKPEKVAAVLQRMAGIGWIDVAIRRGNNAGTEIRLNGIEGPKPLSPDPAQGDPNAGVPVSSIQGQGLSDLGSPVSPMQGHFEEGKKQTHKNKKPPPPPKPQTPAQADRVVAVWNTHKPKAWQSIATMGTRMRVVEHLARQLGGFETFLELLPLALTEAAADSWWRSKRMSWANFMGTGNTAKAHFEEMVDRALAKGTSAATAGRDPDRLEHPDFFRPNPSGRLIARSGVTFASVADKQSRAAAALAFYSQQTSA